MQTTESGGPRGHDAGKKVTGRKRQVMVDDDGGGLVLEPQPAVVQDREAAPIVDSHSLRQPLGSSRGSRPSTSRSWCRCGCSPVALACGNCFILKPSERDPSASILLAEWLKEAGLPDGVFNVAQSDKTAVDAILTDPDISAVSAS